ncbi:MAG: FkbM family methyltransferase [Thermoanaerobaculia bacterium]
MIRGLLEKLSRGRLLHRALPPEFGGARVLVSPDSRLSYWIPGLRRTSPELFRWCAEFVEAGSTVWDVGANLGLFSYAAAFRAGATGSVVAVEPDSFLAGIVRRNARALDRRYAPIDVREMAMSSDVGRGELVIATRGRESNHLLNVGGSTQSGGARETQTVEVGTLDRLYDELGAPDLVKLDAEGAEHLILEGGRRLLESARPLLLIEVSGIRGSRVGEQLAAAGYRMFDADARAPGRVEQEIPAYNTLAVPTEGVSIR